MQWRGEDQSWSHRILTGPASTMKSPRQHSWRQELSSVPGSQSIAGARTVKTCSHAVNLVSSDFITLVGTAEKKIPPPNINFSLLRVASVVFVNVASFNLSVSHALLPLWCCRSLEWFVGEAGRRGPCFPSTATVPFHHGRSPERPGPDTDRQQGPAGHLPVYCQVSLSKHVKLLLFRLWQGSIISWSLCVCSWAIK